MSTPTGRREALEVLTRRGVSHRKACGYLGRSRRVATYTLKQPEKDRSLGEQLMAAAQELPRFGYRRMSAWLALGESRVRRMWSLAAQHSAAAASPSSLWQRHLPARCDTTEFGLELRLRAPTNWSMGER